MALLQGSPLLFQPAYPTWDTKPSTRTPGKHVFRVLRCVERGGPCTHPAARLLAASTVDVGAAVSLPVAIPLVGGDTACSHPSPFASFSVAVAGDGRADAVWSAAVVVGRTSLPSADPPLDAVSSGAAPSSPSFDVPLTSATAMSDGGRSSAASWSPTAFGTADGDGDAAAAASVAAVHVAAAVSPVKVDTAATDGSGSLWETSMLVPSSGCHQMIVPVLVSGVVVQCMLNVSVVEDSGGCIHVTLFRDPEVRAATSFSRTCPMSHGALWLHCVAVVETCCAL